MSFIFEYMINFESKLLFKINMKYFLIMIVITKLHCYMFIRLY